MRMINWVWLFWQVALPIGGPSLVSAFVILLWSTGAQGFVPDYAWVLASISPWALVIYAVTLLANALRTIIPTGRQGLIWATVACTVAIFLYAGFIVIWNHYPDYQPNGNIYKVTIILLFSSIIVSHGAHNVTEQG